jgi:hypothetical protein
MPPNPNYQQILDFMQITMPLMSREYGHLFTKGILITQDISYPNHPLEEAEIKRNIKTLLKGSVLTNIFAIWEKNTPSDILDWMTSEETSKLQAFRHVRDSISHNYFGGRADYASRRTAFENEHPFSNIDFDSTNDSIDISNSTVDKDCWEYFQELAKKLVVRLHQNEKPTV